MPDFFYLPATDHYDGICMYLDGMSRELHGNPERQKRDRRIREEVRDKRTGSFLSNSDKASDF